MAICNDLHQRAYKHKKKAFTLLEVLVVIAIIGSLLAVLMPGLQIVRGNARRIRCASNLKQIAQAWDMYLDEYDGKFYQGLKANVDYGGWRGAIQAYPRPLNASLGLPNDITNENDAEVFRCPADQGGIPRKPPSWTAHSYFGTSYQTNIFLIGQTACGEFSPRTAELDRLLSERISATTRDALTTAPSRLLLMGDYAWINQWHPSLKLPAVLKTQGQWHSKPDFYNMAFLDGHVEFTRIQKSGYVTDEYTLIPFGDLLGLAQERQWPLEKLSK